MIVFAVWVIACLGMVYLGIRKGDKNIYHIRLSEGLTAIKHMGAEAKEATNGGV